MSQILRLPAWVFRAWEQFNEISPIGDVRGDYHAALIAQMLYNVNRSKKDKALPLEDFLLPFDGAKEKPRQTPAQQFAMLKLLAAMHANDVPVSKVIDMNPHLAGPLAEAAGIQSSTDTAPPLVVHSDAEASALARARAAMKAL